eukprot:3934501-Rhodomonas_salina.1
MQPDTRFPVPAACGHAPTDHAWAEQAVLTDVFGINALRMSISDISRHVVHQTTMRIGWRRPGTATDVAVWRAGGVCWCRRSRPRRWRPRTRMRRPWPTASTQLRSGAGSRRRSLAWTCRRWG